LFSKFSTFQIFNFFSFQSDERINCTSDKGTQLSFCSDWWSLNSNWQKTETFALSWRFAWGYDKYLQKRGKVRPTTFSIRSFAAGTGTHIMYWHFNARAEFMHIQTWKLLYHYEFHIFSVLPKLGKRRSFKGSLTRDFRLQVFFVNQCPPGLWVSRWDRYDFFRKSRR